MVVGQYRNSIREIAFVARIEHESGFPIMYKFLGSARLARGHQGEPGCRRFQKYYAEGIAKCWKYKHVSLIVKPRELRLIYEASEVNPLQSKAANEVLKMRFFRPRADNCKAHWAACWTH
jgi:hypothetical protein